MSYTAQIISIEVKYENRLEAYMEELKIPKTWEECRNLSIKKLYSRKYEEYRKFAIKDFYIYHLEDQEKELEYQTLKIKKITLKEKREINQTELALLKQVRLNIQELEYLLKIEFKVKPKTRPLPYTFKWSDPYADM